MGAGSLVLDGRHVLPALNRRGRTMHKVVRSVGWHGMNSVLAWTFRFGMFCEVLLVLSKKRGKKEGKKTSREVLTIPINFIASPKLLSLTKRSRGTR